MADNYLERQRELYEIRKAKWEKEKRYKIKKKSPSNVSKSMGQTGENSDKQS